MSWNSCNRIKLRRWRWVSRSRTLWSWPMHFFCFEPFDTLVACEFEGEALCSNNHCAHIDKYVAINCLTGKVEILISFDEECCH